MIPVCVATVDATENPSWVRLGTSMAGRVGADRDLQAAWMSCLRLSVQARSF